MPEIESIVVLHRTDPDRVKAFSVCIATVDAANVVNLWEWSAHNLKLLAIEEARLVSRLFGLVDVRIEQ